MAMQFIDSSTTLDQKGNNCGMLTNDMARNAHENQINWFKVALQSIVVVISLREVNSKEISLVKCANMATGPEIPSNATSAVMRSVVREN